MSITSASIFCNLLEPLTNQELSTSSSNISSTINTHFQIPLCSQRRNSVSQSGERSKNDKNFASSPRRNCSRAIDHDNKTSRRTMDTRLRTPLIATKECHRSIFLWDNAAIFWHCDLLFDRRRWYSTFARNGGLIAPQTSCFNRARKE